MSRDQIRFAERAQPWRLRSVDTPTEAAESAGDPALPLVGTTRAVVVVVAVGVGIAALATLALLLDDSIYPFPVVAALLFSLGVGLIGYALGARQRAVVRVVAAVPGEQTRRKLLVATIPLWLRQLEAARHEGVGAIDDLARSFNEIVTGLERALKESRTAVAEMQGCGGAAAQLRVADTDLRGLVRSIQTLRDAKDVALTEIERCGRDLREINGEVNQLSLQSRLLSLNAAIEAARAGEAGRPFAAVVTEMRQLAARISEASRCVADQLGQIEAAVQAMQQQDGHRASSDLDSIKHAETEIGAVMQYFSTLTESLGKSITNMDVSGEQVRGKIADALVALQFQDRVSQILSHTMEDLDKLGRHLAAGTLDERAIAAWRSDMTEKFTTREELASVRRTRLDGSSNDVTFF